MSRGKWSESQPAEILPGEPPTNPSTALPPTAAQDVGDCQGRSEIDHLQDEKIAFHRSAATQRTPPKAQIAQSRPNPIPGDKLSAMRTIQSTLHRSWSMTELSTEQQEPVSYLFVDADLNNTAANGKRKNSPLKPESTDTDSQQIKRLNLGNSFEKAP